MILILLSRDYFWQIPTHVNSMFPICQTKKPGVRKPIETRNSCLQDVKSVDKTNKGDMRPSASVRLSSRKLPVLNGTGLGFLVKFSNAANSGSSFPDMSRTQNGAITFLMNGRMGRWRVT